MYTYEIGKTFSLMISADLTLSKNLYESFSLDGMPDTVYLLLLRCLAFEILGRGDKPP